MSRNQDPGKVRPAAKNRVNKKNDGLPRMSHVDAEGRARMVDVGAKPDQRRVARARGLIKLAPKTLELIAGNLLKKGDVLTVAEIAGVQAAKRTWEWIPLCHTILLTGIVVKAVLDPEGIVVTSEVTSCGRTGVEMEALTAVSAALLTVYDMCKAVDKQMVMGNILLLEKTKE